MIRISSSSYFQAVLPGLNEQRRSIARLTEQLANNTRLVAPSDDVFAFSRATSLTETVAVRTQYLANQTRAQMALNQSNTVLTQMDKNLTLVRIPGAFEMPVVARRMAASKKYDGVICLGAVIRGATPHFDFVAGECVKGMAQVALETGVPVGFGVLTCDTLEQAIERAGSKAGNKGVEAAHAVLETVRVLEQL